MVWKKTRCVFMTCSSLSLTKNTLTGSPRQRARLEPNASTKHLQQYPPMAGGIYSCFDGHHHGLQRRPGIAGGCLRPGTCTDTLSYPHTHMHTLAHHKWLYGQNLDSVGSKAEKLTVTAFGDQGFWGAKSSSCLCVSPALGKPF